MIDRKKKLLLIQLSLLLVGIIIILFTYTKREKFFSEQIIPETTQEKIKIRSDDPQKGDIFYNIEYSGLDLAGNRYILKSEEAYSSSEKKEEIIMKIVNAIFYFKDDTVLYVQSDKGKYNNKTLDMNFEGNVVAKYEKSQLLAEKADYSNTKSSLTISKNVKIIDSRGSMVADKLLFDIKNKKLNIASSSNSKVNANVNLKWKKDLEY